MKHFKIANQLLVLSDEQCNSSEQIVDNDAIKVLIIKRNKILNKI